jgi:hypothetical protein
MAFAFQKQRLRGKEPLGKKKKIETLRQKKKIVLLYITR